jgi:hypothetical protein
MTEKWTELCVDVLMGCNPEALRPFKGYVNGVCSGDRSPSAGLRLLIWAMRERGGKVRWSFWACRFCEFSSFPPSVCGRGSDLVVGTGTHGK